MDGTFPIGARAVSSDVTFLAIDPSTDAKIEPAFAVSSQDDIAAACSLADAAFDTFRETDPEARAVFLETIADEIEAIHAPLVRAGDAGERPATTTARR